MKKNNNYNNNTKYKKAFLDTKIHSHRKNHSQLNHNNNRIIIIITNNNKIIYKANSSICFSKILQHYRLNDEVHTNLCIPLIDCVSIATLDGEEP